jgi:hypothetical protein
MVFECLARYVSMLVKIGRFLYNHWKKILFPSLLMVIGLVLCATGVLAPIGIPVIAASIAIPIGVTLGSFSLLTLALKISPPRSVKFPPGSVRAEEELVYSRNERVSWFNSLLKFFSSKSFRSPIPERAGFEQISQEEDIEPSVPQEPIVLPVVNTAPSSSSSSQIAISDYSLAASGFAQSSVEQHLRSSQLQGGSTAICTTYCRAQRHSCCHYGFF